MYNIHYKKITTTLLLLFFCVSMCLNFKLTDNDKTIIQKNPQSAEVLGPLSFYMNWPYMISMYPTYVSGSGTYLDPYIIEDAIIDAQQSGSGIFIEMSGVNEYIIIRNCTITNSSTGSEHAGIRLDQCYNVVIEDCTMYNNSNGIYMNHVNNFTIQNNAMFNNTNGINFYAECTNGTIYQNNVTQNTQYGIVSNYYSNNNTYVQNNITSNYYGLYLFYSSGNNVTENTIDENFYISVYMHYSTYNNLIQNYIYSHINRGGTFQSYGVNIDNSESITVDANYINSFFYDIVVSYSPFTRVRNNTIRNDYETGSFIGIDAYFSQNCTFQGNNLAQSDYGINFHDANYTLCRDNFLYPIKFYGIYFYNTNYTTVYSNLVQMATQTGNYARDGIIIESSSFYNVSNNYLFNAKSYSGIRVGASGYNGTVFYNYFDNCGTGINVYSGSRYNNISNNTILNSNAGFSVQSSYSNMIFYNNILGSISYGFYLQFTSDNEIAYNSVRGSGTVPLYTDGVADNIHDNDFYVESAHFTINATKLFVNQTYSFNATTSTGDSPLSYIWDFGDGTWGSNSSVVYHQYNSTGTYSITLWITDAMGSSSNYTITKSIVEDTKPSLEISANTYTVILNGFIQFVATVIGGDTPYTYQWNFGDGSSNSTIYNPNHQFNSIGNFTVNCFVYDYDGDFDFRSVNVTVIVNSGNSGNETKDPSEDSTNDLFNEILNQVGEFFQQPQNIAYTGGGIFVLILYGLFKGRGGSKGPKAPKPKKSKVSLDDEPSFTEFKF